MSADLRVALAEMRDRVEGATEGPWAVMPVGQGGGRPDRYDVLDVSGPIAQYLDEDADATFIAHARTDLPALLDAVEAVLGLIDIGSPTLQGIADDDSIRDVYINVKHIRRAITDALGGTA